MSASTVADVGMLVWCGGLVSLGQSRFGGLSSFGPSTYARHLWRDNTSQINDNMSVCVVPVL